MNRLHRTATALILATLLGAPAAARPPQEPSLGEAARKLRQQKSAAPKAARVWTNDNLPPAGGVAPAAGPEASAAAAMPGEAPPSPADETERDELEQAIAKTRRELAVVKKDLELAAREFELQRQQFYSNPAYASDRAGKAALDALETRRNQKQQEVQQGEASLAALEDKLKALHQRLGPKKEAPSEAQQRAAWSEKVRPLREELSRVEGDLARIRAEAAAQGRTAYGPTVGGGFTADMIAQLEQRRSELQRQIAAIEDEARRAGIAPAWLR